MTIQYPEEKTAVYPRFRGRHKLHRFEDTGLEKFIICAVWKGCWRDRVARIATAFDFAVPLRQFLAH